MPHTHYPTTPDGLVLDVVIGIDGGSQAALVNAGQQPPRPLLLRAQIDTASTITCIAARVVTHFGLTSFQGHTTQTVAGSIPVNLYEVSLSIPRSGALTAALLYKLLLISDGPRGEFTLSH
jgi:hypothetical protein